MVAEQGRALAEVPAFELIALTIGYFVVRIALSQPKWAAVLNGYIPAAYIVKNQTQLYIAMIILGATVMPLSLYLHTAVVQSRASRPMKLASA